MCEGNMYKIPRLARCKNREQIYSKEKISHIQDSIYVIQQFSYVHVVAEISLFSWKKYKIWQYSCLSQNNIKTLISKTTIFISYTHNSQWVTKRAKKFSRDLSMSATAQAYQPKSPLHGLNLKKSPIKSRNNIISSRVIIRIKHNLNPQNPTHVN